MNILLIRYSLLFLMISVFNVYPQYSKAGSVSYQHLLLNYDGRSAGMAGANVALPSGLEGVAINPAVIGSIERQQLFIGYQSILDGVWCSPISYLHPFTFGIVAVTMQGLTSGDVQQIDEINREPVITGKVAHCEYLTPSISFGRSFFQKRILAGVSVKGMYERIVVPSTTYSSTAIGMDLGVQYRINSDRFIAGMVLRNFGFEFKSFEDDESLPTPFIFEVGISYIPRYLPNVRICADINKARGDYINFEPGLEIELYPKTLFFRLGYPFSQADLKEQLNKFSGDNDENYVKSNWTTLACGIGVHAPINNFFIKFDCGLQLREDSQPPCLIYSAVIDF